MINDDELAFSINQAIVATAFSDNSIEPTRGNTNTAVRDIAPGTPVRVVSYVTETFDALTSLNFELFVNTVDSFSGAETLVFEHSQLLADLVQGEKLVDFALPRGILPPAPIVRLFYKARYTVVGSNPTVGQLSTYFSWSSHAASHDVN